MPAGGWRQTGIVTKRAGSSRPEAVRATASPPDGHDRLRTVRLGGEARRSAARRDLATNGPVPSGRSEPAARLIGKDGNALHSLYLFNHIQVMTR